MPVEPTIALTTTGDVLEDGRPYPVRTQICWSLYEPASLVFDFLQESGDHTTWELSREVVLQALATDGLVGYKDADVLMGGRPDSPYFVLVLSSPEGRAYVRLPRPDVEAAVAMSRGEIEVGSPEEVAHYAHEVDQLLAEMGLA